MTVKELRVETFLLDIKGNKTTQLANTRMQLENGLHITDMHVRVSTTLPTDPNACTIMEFDEMDSGLLPKSITGCGIVSFDRAGHLLSALPDQGPFSVVLISNDKMHRISGNNITER